MPGFLFNKVRVSFLISCTLKACNFIKKRFWHSWFSVKFKKFLKTHILQTINKRLLLFLGRLKSYIISNQNFNTESQREHYSLKSSLFYKIFAKNLIVNNSNARLICWPPSPRTPDVNWMYVRRSEDVLCVFWTYVYFSSYAHWQFLHC